MKKALRISDILLTLSDGASSFPSWSRSLTGSEASPTSMGLRKLTRLHTLLTHYHAPYAGECLAMLDSDLMHGLPHAYPCHYADWSRMGGYPSTPVGELRVRSTAPYQKVILTKNYIKLAAFIPHTFWKGTSRRIS